MCLGHFVALLLQLDRSSGCNSPHEQQQKRKKNLFNEWIKISAEKKNEMQTDKKDNDGKWPDRI